jgi:hypothetical protein
MHHKSAKVVVTNARCFVYAVTVSNQTPKRRSKVQLSEADRAEVKRLLSAGVRKEVLAVQFGVHFNTIGNIEKEPANENAPRLEHEGQVRTTSTNDPSVARKGKGAA